MRSPFRLSFVLPWPLPALLAWGAAWGTFIALGRAGAPLLAAMGVASVLGLAFAGPAPTRWRQVFVAAGFPVSLAASGLAGAMPAWAWLLPLALLLLLYPLGTWRDAPVYPTAPGALRSLGQCVPLAPGARIVDAGCGLGDGLRELRREYPDASLVGWEWSWPLRIACGWRCRFATIRRVDIWTADWSGFDMVYLFQRPESMPRAAEKAAREMRPGRWLASLAFEVPGVAPTHVIDAVPGRRVWLYRLPLVGVPAPPFAPTMNVPDRGVRKAKPP